MTLSACKPVVYCARYLFYYQGITRRESGFWLDALGAVHNSGGLDIGYQYEPVTVIC